MNKAPLAVKCQHCREQKKQVHLHMAAFGSRLLPPAGEKTVHLFILGGLNILCTYCTVHFQNSIQYRIMNNNVLRFFPINKTIGLKLTDLTSLFLC